MEAYIFRRCRILLIILLLCGCGFGNDKGKGTPITATWELTEFTVNGTTTKAEELEAELRPIAPAFACDVQSNCVISNNGKDHKGTIEKTDDGKYVISFGDTDQTMTAEISGDLLTIKNNKGTLTLIFKAQ